MIEGAFVAQDSDRHVRFRRGLLESGTILPSPISNPIQAQAKALPDAIEDTLFRQLRDTGLLVLQLDEPASTDRFAALGSLLGTPIPETDPAVEPYVEKDVVLNLVSEHDRTSDVSLQPFATNFLTLHTESSGRPESEQPRYIVLMCCDRGDSGTAAQTVLVPAKLVEQGLSSSTMAVLARTRYRRNDRGPMIVRDVDDRRVFSFRDFLWQPLHWHYSDDDNTEEDVNSAIRALLSSMYRPTAAGGVHWSRGALVVIDNTYFFHGRAASAGSMSSRRRHLKRLRIL